MAKFRDFSRDKKLSIGELNDGFAEVERLGGISAIPPLEVIYSAGGPVLSFTGGGFYAILTSVCSSSSVYTYGWSEVVPDGSGNWTTLSGGRTGSFANSPAFEINNRNVRVGEVVRLRPGVKTEFLFQFDNANGGAVSACPSGSSSSSSSTSSSSTGGTVNTDCCNGLPTTLYATLSSASCACMSYTQACVYDSGQAAWLGTKTNACSGFTMVTKIYCSNALSTPKQFSIQFTCDGLLMNFSAQAFNVTCSPFSGSGTYTVNNSPSCCSNGNTIDFTVTP